MNERQTSALQESVEFRQREHAGGVEWPIEPSRDVSRPGHGARAVERGGRGPQHGHKGSQFALAKVRVRLEWPVVLEAHGTRGVRTIVRELEVEAYGPIRAVGRQLEGAHRASLNCQVSDGSRDGSPWPRKRAGKIEVDRQIVEVERLRRRGRRHRGSAGVSQVTHGQRELLPLAADRHLLQAPVDVGIEAKPSVAAAQAKVAEAQDAALERDASAEGVDDHTVRLEPGPGKPAREMRLVPRSVQLS